jgi:hypothetical protein
VHEVDVLGQRFAQGLGHRLHAAIGHESATDLRLDLLAHPIDSVLVFVALQALFELRQFARLLLRCLHQPVEHAVEVEVAQRAVEVIRAAHRATWLHAAEAGDGRFGDRPHHRLVGVEQSVVEHLGQLFGGQSFEPAGPALLGLTGLVLPRQFGLAVGPDHVLRTTQREIDLEHRLERSPVGGVLDQRATERVFERVAILHGDDLDGLHGVEVLGEAHRQTGPAKFDDEASEEVDHHATAGRARLSLDQAHVSVALLVVAGAAFTTITCR